MSLHGPLVHRRVPGARQEGGDAYGFVFDLIGLLLGPTGVALVFVFVSSGTPLKRDFLDRVVNHRIRPLYDSSLSSSPSP
jgi:hypothetical protein